MENIRNFCVISHIDHGKSTLADRFLELTGTVEKRKMHEQYLDTMELERERGITIKLQPVRMSYSLGSNRYLLNLIDTPGHVDFSYEVSRSLAAVEGAILLVDASKGVQAQTLANLHLAQKQGLTIIPAVNKIDLPNARTKQVKEELANLLNINQDEITEVSGKTGANMELLLKEVVKRIPAPAVSAVSAAQRAGNVGSGTPKALIFDSTFDAYKGVIAYVRVFEGEFKRGELLFACATEAKFEILEVGYFSPSLIQDKELKSGQIGYIATGLKDPGLIKVGDTLTTSLQTKPLAGYQEPRPMVFASFFPTRRRFTPKAGIASENSDDYDLLKDALSKLKLTDASLMYEPESSAGLGRGFRVGFLGMLHVEIISERLRREFNLPLIISSPAVEYQIKLKNGKTENIRSASLLPDPSELESISEPVVTLRIISPVQYVGSVMKLAATFRNTYLAADYLGKETVVLKYEMPLSEIITDFYDKLKSVSSGYASMSYEPKGLAVGDLIKLDILVAGDRVEPFSRIVPREKAYYEGRAMAAKLKEVIPPQWFEVAIQAVIGGKVIARESIKARRKDVTGYLYGGDVTRKMKLLEKQKKGKKKMKESGRVNIPQEVFLKMLKR